MIAVPHVLIADEAEEVIDDATAGGRDMDLLGLHEEMLGGTFSCSGLGGLLGGPRG